MSFMMVAGLVFLAMFGLAYLRPGRYGPTVLSLGAGYILAQMWAGQIAGVYGEDLSRVAGPYSWNDVLYLLIVLLPGVCSLLLGQKQRGLLPRMIAALGIGLLALVMVLPALSLTLFMDSGSRTVYGLFDDNKDLIITIALVAGLMDVALSSPLKLPRPNKG